MEPSDDVLLTTEEAMLATGATRNTLQVWLRKGRLKRKAAGKLALADLTRCQLEKHTGRPYAQPPYGTLDSRAKAEEQAKLYFGRGALPKLERMLTAVLWLYTQYQPDRVSAFCDVLLKTLASAPRIQKRNQEANEAVRHSQKRNSYRATKLDLKVIEQSSTRGSGRTQGR